jgi:hypothetical protein
MTTLIPRHATLGLLLLLAACDTGYDPAGGPRILARDTDSAIANTDKLQGKQPAIAIDPDGCQNWIIDDGAEGYASRRRDPVSGLPVCNSRIPPGYVVRDPRVTNFPDILP